MQGVAGQPRRVLPALGVLGALLCGASDPSLVLALLPALALLLLLARGVRPGERLIERLRGQGSTPPARNRATSAARPRLALVVRPAGRLIASALAMRPPPCLLVS